MNLNHLQAYCQSVSHVWGLNRTRRAVRVSRYLLRGLINPLAASHWSSAVRSVPELQLCLTHNPRFLLKPSRHYLNRHYSFAQRAALIASHHAVLARLLAPEQRLLLVSGQSIRLAEITGKRGTPYAITLCRTDKFDREGELILGLRDSAQQRDVFRLAFSLHATMKTLSLEIGCIQGVRSPDARELIKVATKECHGIRPKNLLLEALMPLARVWNVGTVFGVSNASRVYRSAATFADYDTLWSEVGGIAEAGGRFRLPLTLAHRELSEIPNHHRSEYRKRNALRSDLAEKVATTATALLRDSVERADRLWHETNRPAPKQRPKVSLA
ncbi:DUF535 domain-containing protein [Rhodocyclus tenuis]|nr:DUF535 domain-containing protein [Rhodocyclus gracilis]